MTEAIEPKLSLAQKRYLRNEIAPPRLERALTRFGEVGVDTNLDQPFTSRKVIPPTSDNQYDLALQAAGAYGTIVRIARNN